MKGIGEFEEFARAGVGGLYRTAWLLTGDRHHAEDLVQETLANMLKVWSRVETPEAYARTALARIFVSQRRRRSWSERPTSALPEQAGAVGDVALRVALQGALGELAPLDRAVLVLRYFEDRSVEQVALDLGKKPSAITTRTARALERLRVVLGDDAVHLTAL
ncbi:SigE family RNA polymerase sigma factor [Kribbella sandramycini]|uniref:RNA polymerase sigma-70 factor (Sigma-E family) n=1 Tax=Kribbella sandramycini TaxID=60450 RepID=A0A7Y4KVQ3_9ACTN|nr:SigE family RNA polymerase sigma factor [Kribbella sandramycini]MBB6567805.1 RNA polymerase sigma-70 factor (sigma-E family) [Kribbella sandramycini]NOL39599.1 SigE family RNA polymerase sigma factor [Kribbella sandramycini]